MDRRTTLQALAATPLAWLFPNLRPQNSALYLWESDKGDVVSASNAKDASLLFSERTGPGPAQQGVDWPCQFTPGGAGAHDLRPVDDMAEGLRCCMHRGCYAYDGMPQHWKRWPDDKLFSGRIWNLGWSGTTALPRWWTDKFGRCAFKRGRSSESPNQDADWAALVLRGVVNVDHAEQQRIIAQQHFLR
jgi:hypothetical protein